jgi:hypothetical protein
MSENSTVKPNNWTSQASDSCNTKYDAPDGFVSQLALRGDNCKDLLKKAIADLIWFKDNDFLPFGT